MILFAGLSMIWPQNIKGKITSFSQSPYKLKVSFRNQGSKFTFGPRHLHLTGHNIGRDQFHECSTTLAMTHDLTRWTNVLSHIPLGTNQVSIRIHILGHSKVVVSKALTLISKLVQESIDIPFQFSSVSIWCD